MYVFITSSIFFLTIGGMILQRRIHDHFRRLILKHTTWEDFLAGPSTDELAAFQENNNDGLSLRNLKWQSTQSSFSPWNTVVTRLFLQTFTQSYNIHSPEDIIKAEFAFKQYIMKHYSQQRSPEQRMQLRRDIRRHKVSGF